MAQIRLQQGGFVEGVSLFEIINANGYSLYHTTGMPIDYSPVGNNFDLNTTVGDDYLKLLSDRAFRPSYLPSRVTNPSASSSLQKSFAVPLTGFMTKVNKIIIPPTTTVTVKMCRAHTNAGPGTNHGCCSINWSNSSSNPRQTTQNLLGVESQTEIWYENTNQRPSLIPNCIDILCGTGGYVSSGFAYTTRTFTFDDYEYDVSNCNITDNFVIQFSTYIRRGRMEGFGLPSCRDFRSVDVGTDDSYIEIDGEIFLVE